MTSSFRTSPPTPSCSWSAHGNSLRALVKHLDGISDEEISGLNIPTGIPLVYEIGADFRPKERGGPVPRPAGRGGGGPGRGQPGTLTASGTRLRRYVRLHALPPDKSGMTAGWRPHE